MKPKPTYIELELEYEKLLQKLDIASGNEKFKNYFENNKAIMLEVHSETKQIINANQSAIKFYGYSKIQLLQKTIKELHTLSSEGIDKLMKEAIKNESNFFQFQHKLANNEIRDVEIYASPVKFQDKLHMVLTIHDISQRVTAKKELIKAKENIEKSELRYQNLFEYNPVSLWEENLEEVKQMLEIKEKEVDDLKKYLENNPEFVKECASKIIITKINKITLDLLGVKSKDELIEHLSQNFNEKSYEIFKKELLAISKGAKTFTEETEFVRANGEIITAIIQFVVIDNNSNVVVSITDITEKKKIEIELKNQNQEYASLNEEYKAQNEKLAIAKEKAEESDRLKTEFINNMSHEIRTPMNGILGFSSFLGKPNLTDEKRNYYVNIIQNSGSQLMRIIDDIIEISRLGTKQVKVIENKICLNELLLKLFSIFDIKAKEQKISLFLKRGLSDEDSNIMLDDLKLNKILSNLLENAFKFTYTGFIEFGYNIVETDASVSQLKIYVKDTGIGIKPENQEMIFKRFSQEEKTLSRKYDGLGLGLSIAKENTELLGGIITLESVKGKGSVFFVTIPYKPDSSQIPLQGI